MKVGIAFLTYAENTFAGIENSLFRFVDGLIKNNVQVSLFTSKYSNFSEGKNIDIYKCPGLYPDRIITDQDKDKEIISNYLQNNRVIEKHIRNYLSIHQPDYLLAVDHLWGILPFCDIGKLKVNCGLLFHMDHNPEIIRKSLKMPFKHFFSVSKYITEKIHNIDNVKIFSLPNSIDINLYKEKRKKRNENINILCNARISPEKGIEFLVEAFSQIQENHPTMLLHLCGGKFHFMDNSSYYNKIVALVNKKKLNKKIVIHDLIPWNKIPQVIKSMDLVVLPTKTESFGIAALEALAAKTALICSNVANLPYLVRDAAILVEYGNPNQIAIAIKEVFSRPKITKERSEKGYKISHEYCHTKIASDFLKIIS